MKLHLVGGFLGSGKTTAILQAAKALMDQGRRVGVITNDQGKYLVDTAFFRLADIPTVEVTGGCFCCNYDDLNGRLGQLIAASQPDVVFAESVGSCADIVATVVRPLLELAQHSARPASFSVFADARLLRRRLLGQEMPFSDEVVYIYDKQLEEAGQIVVNKIDLLSSLAAEQVAGLLQARYPGKPYRLQSSLSLAGVRPWLEDIQSGSLALPADVLEIDYQRYGNGEEHLAWLDEAVRLRVPSGQGRAMLRRVLGGLVDALQARRHAIGHLKFILRAGAVSCKLSIPTLPEPGWPAAIPDLPGEEINLLVNARVAMPAEELRALLAQALAQSGAEVVVEAESAFHPEKPNPTHRIAP